MAKTAYPYQKLPRNLRGRDFVFGDLHGCIGALRAGLKHIGFDATRDRLISTGDLVDRGEDSLECLKLLENRWFHSVLANHERMLLAKRGYPERKRTRVQALLYADAWDDTLSVNQRELLNRLLPRVATLPAVIEVESGMGSFFVLHAERPQHSEGKPWSDKSLRAGAFQGASLESLTWGRRLFKDSSKLTAVGKLNGIEVVEGPQYETLTYAGHSIVDVPRLVGSHLFIDGGAYRRQKGKPGHLFILEHLPDEGPRLVFSG